MITSFDWNTLSWKSPLAENAQGKSWRMNVTGDWASIREYADVIAGDPEKVYGDLLPLLREGDWNFVNVEAVLGDGGAPIAKQGPNLAGDAASSIASLRAAGFHTGCLANNHAMDFGPEGLKSTIEALKKAGMDYVGAGFEREEVTRPVIRTIHDCRVAVINFSEGEECMSRRGEPGVNGFDIAGVILQIQELKRSGQADVVVVSFHGGRELAPLPPPYVVKALRQIAEGGADAVIAHHPHVPQGIEIYHGVPIAYSLGNFVFWQKDEIWSRHAGYLVHLNFRGKQLSSLEVTPYLTEVTGLRKMREDELGAFAERMERVTRKLSSERDVEAVWAAFGDRVFELGYGFVRIAQYSQAVLEKRDDAQTDMRLCNYFWAPAHANMLSEILDRRAHGTFGKSPEWAVNLVAEWLGK